MAIGSHWEWRGFGAVSSRFADRFCRLWPQFAPKRFEDVYLWIPGLELNIKLRDYAEQPFKIKRITDRDGQLEKWDEDPDLIFRFPLGEADWAILTETLAAVGLTMGRYPSPPPDRDATLALLKAAGAATLLVDKFREARLWRGPSGLVLAEWACLRAPQTAISVGLETWDEDPDGPGLPDELAKKDIVAAISALGLREEPLRVLSYVGAVGLWAQGEKL